MSMRTESYEVFTCDRPGCGKQQRVDHVEDYDGWVTLDNVKKSNTGGPFLGGIYKFHICPSCADSFKIWWGHN